MKRIISISIVLLLTFNLFAQHDVKAKAIIDKASAKIQSSSLKVEFTLLVEDLKTKQSESVKGDLFMKGSKFKLKLSDMETFFDGKTQWVYMPGNKEVSIANPDEEELQEINPTLVLSGYSKTGIIQFAADNKTNSPNYSVDIYPENKKKSFFKINVVLNKQTMELVSIKIFGRNAVNTTLQVNKYQQGVNIEEAMFVFDVKKYPGITVNDLR
jgi:outer membrane lipoprotein-sorting protein